MYGHNRISNFTDTKSNDKVYKLKHVIGRYAPHLNTDVFCKFRIHDLKMSAVEFVCCNKSLTLLTKLCIEANSVDPSGSTFHCLSY